MVSYLPLVKEIEMNLFKAVITLASGRIERTTITAQTAQDARRFVRVALKGYDISHIHLKNISVRE
jgi:hypothetical protein